MQFNLMVKKTEFQTNWGKFERPGATYTHVIYLPNQKLMGHSKPVGQKEKDNKRELFCDVVTRLQRKDYFKKSVSVDFYRNFSLNDKDSRLICTLYSNRFAIDPSFIEHKWLVEFLQGIYKAPEDVYGTLDDPFPESIITTGMVEDRLNTFPTKSAKGLDPLNINMDFKSLENLLDYTDKLKRDGHPKGAVIHYFRKVCDRYKSIGRELK